MKKTITLLSVAIIPLCVCATDIKGRFIAPKSTTLPYQVTVESCDTINRWNVESTFYEPTFNISIENKGCCTFKIRQQGETVYTDSLTLTDAAINLGNIKAMKTIEIGEVEIKGKKINIRRDGTDYTISNIQGTHLGDAGNLVEMLKWTPGVTVSRS